MFPRGTMTGGKKKGLSDFRKGEKGSEISSSPRGEEKKGVKLEKGWNNCSITTSSWCKQEREKGGDPFRREAFSSKWIERVG